MPQWPRSQLLRHGPELPMAERICRYQHNIRVIRESGCRVPTPALLDTLDPKEIAPGSPIARRPAIASKS